MSEQEKKSSSTVDLSVVLVEQSATSRHKQPFRPVEIQEEGSKELQHKRSKAPTVPSVTEDNVNIESKGKTEIERAVSSEKHKYNVAKKLSSVTKRRPSSPETITLTPLVVDMKTRPMNLPSDHTTLKNSLTPSQPIPALVSPTAEDSDLATKHSEVAKVSSEWSDEEEAGGLPRSDSRASRVSRAVRQLFCCGMPLEPPSEHNISPRTEHDVV